MNNDTEEPSRRQNLSTDGVSKAERVVSRIVVPIVKVLAPIVVALLTHSR